MRKADGGAAQCIYSEGVTEQKEHIKTVHGRQLKTELEGESGML